MPVFLASNGTNSEKISIENFCISENKITCKIHQDEHLAEFHRINNSSLVIKWRNKIFRIELLKMRAGQNQCLLRVNGKKINIQKQTDTDILLENLGFSSSRKISVNSIKAPMPGKVLKIMVQEGTSVKKGDVLFILEAMKMENAIKSPGDGTVKKLLMKPGDVVEKNQLLLEF